ncbi:MAG: hypothetical protein K2N27_06715 [Ruminococcus sp.]|nr:hypothetical protein [Ruminococcus sp.]
MKNYKKRTFALLISLFCMNLYGCSDNQTALYDPNALPEESTSTTSSSEETTLSTENITPLRQTIQDISNAFIINGDTPPELAMLCFTEETDISGTLTEIDRNSLPIKDGTLQVGLNLLVYSPEEMDCKVKGTFVMFWNGLPYDFSVGDMQSKDGALQLDLMYNEEIVLPMESLNLPVQEGKNTLYLCFIPYCEEKGIYLTPQRYYAYYNSEQQLDGRTPISITDEKELPQEYIEIFTDRAVASGTYHSVERADVIKSKNDSYTLHSAPTFYLNIANFMNIETPSNRSGIGMLVSNGELQPIWNGQKYLSVALTAEELRKTISVKTPYQSGEKHDICMLYAELENDQEFDCEPFSYSEMSYCTIEE